MKIHIDQVSVSNFKQMNRTTFQLNQGLTIITGLNGSGKTSLIEALATWPVPLSDPTSYEQQICDRRNKDKKSSSHMECRLKIYECSSSHAWEQIVSDEPPKILYLAINNSGYMMPESNSAAGSAQQSGRMARRSSSSTKSYIPSPPSNDVSVDWPWLDDKSKILHSEGQKFCEIYKELPEVIVIPKEMSLTVGEISVDKNKGSEQRSSNAPPRLPLGLLDQALQRLLDKTLVPKSGRRSAEMLAASGKIDYWINQIDKHSGIRVTVSQDKGQYPEVSAQINGSSSTFQELSSGQRWVVGAAILLAGSNARIDGQSANLLILADEPGGHMHLSALQSIRRALLSLSKTYQVVYTTHSEHMIQQAPPGSLRVMQHKDGEIRCLCPEELAEDPLEELLPMTMATASEALEIINRGQKLLIVEGSSEQVYLEHIRSVLDPTGEKLSRDVTIIDANSISGIPKLLKLCPTSASVVVMTDLNPDDAQVCATIDKIRSELRRWSSGVRLIHPVDNIGDIEDCFDRAEMISLIEYAMGNQQHRLEVRDQQRLTQAIDGWMKRNNMHSKHGSLAKHVVKYITDDKIRDSRANLESLLMRIGDAFRRLDESS